MVKSLYFKNDRVSVWVCECLNELMSEWASKRTNEKTSDWVSEWVNDTGTHIYSYTGRRTSAYGRYEEDEETHPLKWWHRRLCPSKQWLFYYINQIGHRHSSTISFTMVFTWITGKYQSKFSHKICTNIFIFRVRSKDEDLKYVRVPNL